MVLRTSLSHKDQSISCIPFSDYCYSFYRNDILQGILTTIQLTVTWQPLQIMSDSTKRWPSDKVNHSCENALYFHYFLPVVWNICTIVLDLTRTRQYVHIYSSTFISTAQCNAWRSTVYQLCSANLPCN